MELGKPAAKSTVAGRGERLSEAGIDAFEVSDARPGSQGTTAG